MFATFNTSDVRLDSHDGCQRYKLMLQADPPDHEKIPEGDAIGAADVFLSCFYKEHQFFRMGYFVNNEYIDPELKDNPPPVASISSGNQ
ncbi:hypothetical protein DAPPUDRAFT_265753 [Daphnia pulex]|uniref:Uncharacterized protein n=1 Tax=Daphnia pulex TaxID=6669 RepID=E9HTX9_DAPPU|nr:hypothetical protein DAPPUDRAFT_265753 [Daphnia pulex]|eukprot:EFX64801.1 hypothetical protein DAPPUDRAFT_265753 [Daphnia pulex]